MSLPREKSANKEIRQLKHLYQSLNHRDQHLFERGVTYAGLLLGFPTLSALVEHTKEKRDEAIAEIEDGMREDRHPDTLYFTGGYTEEDRQEARGEEGGKEEDEESDLELIQNVQVDEDFFAQDDSPLPFGNDDEDAEGEEDVPPAMTFPLHTGHLSEENLISSSVQKSSPMWGHHIALPNGDLTLPTSDYGSPHKGGLQASDFEVERSIIVPSKRDVQLRREREARKVSKSQPAQVHAQAAENDQAEEDDEDIVVIDGKTYLRHPTKPGLLIPALTMMELSSASAAPLQHDARLKSQAGTASHSMRRRANAPTLPAQRPGNLSRSASMQALSSAARPQLQKRPSLAPPFELNSASSISTSSSAQSSLHLPRYDSASPSHRQRLPIPSELDPKKMDATKYPQWLKVKLNPRLIKGELPPSPLDSNQTQDALARQRGMGDLRKAKSMSDLAGVDRRRRERSASLSLDGEDEEDMGTRRIHGSPRKARGRKSTSAVDMNNGKAVTAAGVRRKRASLPSASIPSDTPRRATRAGSQVPKAVIVISQKTADGVPTSERLQNMRVTRSRASLAPVVEEAEDGKRMTRSRASLSLAEEGEEVRGVKRKAGAMGEGVRKRGRKD
ncbi:hypothetical protein BT69DRAFT_1317216 [Atractiella rhizophila]|nr:hypothetical protein BT69DRAFT_1317216 [Atractiella rhizophila]